MHQTYLKCNLLKCSQIIIIIFEKNVQQLLFKLFVVITVPLIQTETWINQTSHFTSFFFFVLQY